jgi:hypothetical protein
MYLPMPFLKMVAIPLLARLQTPVTIVTPLSRAAKPFLVLQLAIGQKSI